MPINLVMLAADITVAPSLGFWPLLELSGAYGVRCPAVMRHSPGSAGKNVPVRKDTYSVSTLARKCRQCHSAWPPSGFQASEISNSTCGSATLSHRLRDTAV